MDLYHYATRVECAKERLKGFKEGDLAIAFLNHLKTKGLSDARLWFYASRLTITLKWFQDRNISLKDASRKDIEAFISYILSKPYKAWTKHAYAILIKKLISFAKTEDSDAATEEVSWIKPTSFARNAEKESRATPEALLTQEEILKLFSSAGSKRDRAMLYVAYEGALRPGELLSMKVSSVQFKDRYCLISVSGKTGIKRIPLVLAHPILLEWLNEHPMKGDPSAPLWPDKNGKPMSIYSFYSLLKRVMKHAGISKRVWPYLFRHTRLTEMAKVLTEPRLALFAGWVQGSKMSRKYVHFSARDLEDAILEVNGLKQPERDVMKLEVKKCSRCGYINPPDAPRCEKCGYTLDQKLALEEELDIRERLKALEEKLTRLLSQK
jgi:site-specific recombinase XerD/ribosomal protein L40E